MKQTKRAQEDYPKEMFIENTQILINQDYCDVTGSGDILMRIAEIFYHGVKSEENMQSESKTKI